MRNRGYQHAGSQLRIVKQPGVGGRRTPVVAREDIKNDYISTEYQPTAGAGTMPGQKLGDGSSREKVREYPRGQLRDAGSHVLWNPGPPGFHVLFRKRDKVRAILSTGFRSCLSHALHSPFSGNDGVDLRLLREPPALAVTLRASPLGYSRDAGNRHSEAEADAHTAAAAAATASHADSENCRGTAE